MEFIRVEDCCEILDSQRKPITESERVPGRYPYYGANGIQGTINQYIFDGKLVLVAEDGGHFGSKTKSIAYLVNGKCWVNNHAHVLRAKKGFLAEYICYSLMFYKIEGYINGATRQKLTQAALRKLIIPKRSVEYQKAIVDRLDLVRYIIEKKQNIINELDLLIKSRFVEMFGDIDCNTKNWPIIALEELAELMTDGEHSTPKRCDKGIYLLSARNILNHSLKLDDVDYIDEAEYDRISKRVIPKAGDILLSCSGSVGRCCMAPMEIKFQLVRSVALIRFKSEITPIFAEHMITSDWFQRQINSLKTTSSQANLFQGRIKKLKGFVPDMNLQYEFIKVVNQINKLKFA
ncbi:restriction endonuclease subunit S [Veillonella hominis]|uniref:Restriction endonuclease subunit S n=1 Tax=Veillonella hominis TaxID=2764330 RepID=A0ABR7JX69_9FIRM|nr:restriction endonuclease subunit S [Veillonella hominis]MBC6001341.1 restriction endonuclease subunit S [Veillonella hominis]